MASSPSEAIRGDDIDRALLKWEPKVWRINRRIFARPETGYNEKLASSLWASLLEESGFNVRMPFHGMETSFFAAVRSGPAKYVLLAEYDALPDIGHGCGHNLSGAISVLAALALGDLSGIAGVVLVIGTPAEESGGSKVILAESGVMDDVDLAAMIHCGNATAVPFRSLAIDAQRFAFEGGEASDALMFFLHCLDMIRDNPPEGVFIHGIVRHGQGSEVDLYIRAPERDLLERITGRVNRCAEGASKATGSSLGYDRFEPSFENMLPNDAAEKFLERLFILEGEKLSAEVGYGGSSDIGNISHRCPAVHPFLSITEKPVALHSREFALATITPLARKKLLSGARVLARLGAKVLVDQPFRDFLRISFDRSKEKAGVNRC
ncbi:MAG TPA: amidohydrolase [Synergistaceae bacterium]|nr:amidohydrolase [Synergistaceae bacterium]